MFRLVQFIFLFSIAGLASCNDSSTSRPQTNSSVATVSANSSGFSLDQRLKDADSLVIVFYKDPYGSDSLRYTRYYTQTSVVNGFEAFNSQLENEYTRQELRKCRTEGKIWCYTKGKVFQTIYFSNKCEECCFTYIIKDGNFYYSKINTVFVNWLASEKSKAVELPNSGAGSTD